MTKQRPLSLSPLPFSPGERRRGRPKGQAPFRKLKGRFEVVLYWALLHYKLENETASRLAVILASPRTSIKSNLVSSSLAQISFEPRHASVNRWRNLPDEAKRTYARLASDPEFEQWVAASYYRLRVLISAVLSNDEKKGEWALVGLAELGWSHLLTAFRDAFLSGTAQTPKLDSWREAKRILKAYQASSPAIPEAISQSRHF